jgi:hypothetical protein
MAARLKITPTLLVTKCFIRFLFIASINRFRNYSAAIHQDGEKHVLFVPSFFRELLGFLPLKQGHAE